MFKRPTKERELENVQELLELANKLKNEGKTIREVSLVRLAAKALESEIEQKYGDSK